jgi:hypothetical protein
LGKDVENHYDYSAFLILLAPDVYFVNSTYLLWIPEGSADVKQGGGDISAPAMVFNTLFIELILQTSLSQTTSNL